MKITRRKHRCPPQRRGCGGPGSCVILVKLWRHDVLAVAEGNTVDHRGLKPLGGDCQGPFPANLRGPIGLQNGSKAKALGPFCCSPACDGKVPSLSPFDLPAFHETLKGAPERATRIVRITRDALHRSGNDFAVYEPGRCRHDLQNALGWSTSANLERRRPCAMRRLRRRRYVNRALTSARRSTVLIELQQRNEMIALAINLLQPRPNTSNK